MGGLRFLLRRTAARIAFEIGVYDRNMNDKRGRVATFVTILELVMLDIHGDSTRIGFIVQRHEEIYTFKSKSSECVLDAQ